MIARCSNTSFSWLLNFQLSPCSNKIICYSHRRWMHTNRRKTRSPTPPISKSKPLSRMPKNRPTSNQVLNISRTTICLPHIPLLMQLHILIQPLPITYLKPIFLQALQNPQPLLSLLSHPLPHNQTKTPPNKISLNPRQIFIITNLPTLRRIPSNLKP